LFIQNCLLHQLPIFKEKLPDQLVSQGWEKFVEENRLFTLESHHNSSFSLGDASNNDIGTG
jgi:hypothetical protein